MKFTAKQQEINKELEEILGVPPVWERGDTSENVGIMLLRTPYGILEPFINIGDAGNRRTVHLLCKDDIKYKEEILERIRDIVKRRSMTYEQYIDYLAKRGEG